MADFTYPDKLGFGETVMFTLRVMATELASDGLDEQYEDLVDHLCYLMSPFVAEAELMDEWEEIDKIGEGILKEQDLILWSKEKRRRIRKKMVMCMDLMQKKKLLLRRHQTHETEYDYSKLPVDKGRKGKGDEG